MSNERSDHLWLEQLADYAEGQLAPADVEQVQQHLASCLHCQEELRWLLATTASLSANSWQAPPLAARASVRRAFRQTQAPVPAQRPKVEAPVTAQPTGLRARLQQEWRALLGSEPRRAFQPALLVALSVLALLITIYSVQQRQGVGPAEAAIPSLAHGTVQVKLAVAEPWQAVTARDEVPPTPFYLHAGAEIATGEESSLQLAFFEHSQTQLGADTGLVVQQLHREARRDTVALFQRRGRVDVRVEPEENQQVTFQIETPSALVQVTGTRFQVEVSADGTTEVMVQEGTVLVSAATVQEAVTAGEMVVVRLGAPPERPAPTALPEQPPIAPSAPPHSPPGQEIRPTRRPLPTQAPPAATEHPAPGQPPDGPPGQEIRPTRKPLPTQAPPAAVTPDPPPDGPPGQEIRPTRRPLPTQAAAPAEPGPPTRRPGR